MLALVPEVAARGVAFCRVASLFVHLSILCMCVCMHVCVVCVFVCTYVLCVCLWCEFTLFSCGIFHVLVV